MTSLPDQCGRVLGLAVSYAKRAGHRAITLLAYEEVARLFRMALAALALGQSPEEERARCRLLLALGDALTRMGDRPAAKEELGRAVGIARRRRMAEELGLAALAYTRRFTFERAASDRHVITLLEDARAMLAENEGAGPVHARVLARLAAALRDQPDRGPRDALSRESVALARRCNDPATLAYTLAGRGAALYGPDDPAERLAVAEELRAVARAAQNKELELEGEEDGALVDMAAGGTTSQVIVHRRGDPGQCLLGAFAVPNAELGYVRRIETLTGLRRERFLNDFTTPITAEDVVQAPPEHRARLQAAVDAGQLVCGFINQASLTTASTDENFTPAAPFVGALTGTRAAAITVALLLGDNVPGGLRWQYNFLSNRAGSRHARSDTCECRRTEQAS